MVLKAQVWICELRAHEKKKKNDFPNPHDIKVTGPDLWLQFRKNKKKFVFNDPKGTGPDL